MSNNAFVPKNLFMASVAAATILGFFPGGASAAVIGPIDTGSYIGPVDIKYTGFSHENTLPAGGTFVGTGLESTFAVAFVTSVLKDNSAINFYSNAIPGIQQIGVFIYGIADQEIVAGPAGSFNIYNVGCTAAGTGCDGKIHADFYLLPNAVDTEFGPGHLVPGNRGVGAANFASFTGITDIGIPFMDWVFDPGKVASDSPAGGFDERLTTLFQNAQAETLPTSGFGNFFASCVGEFGCTFFNNNAYNNGASDFDGRFTLEVDTTAGWGGEIHDPIETAVVPEPGTLALLGAGLLGLLGFRRKHRKS